MLKNRVFEITIDIIDYIGFYTDKETNAMSAINSKILNKCYYGAFIIQVVEILRMSECIIHQTSGMGSLNIQFKAKVIQYNEGELIIGAEVIKVDDSTIVCSTKHANIIASKPHLYSSFKAGQKIIVSVTTARYDMFSNKIKIKAECYTGLPPAIKYVVSNEDINKEILAALLDSMKQIEQETQAIKTERAKDWDSQNDLLYSYASRQAPPSGVTIMQINKFIDNYKPGMVVSRDRKLDLAKPDVYVGGDISNAIEMPITNILSAIIGDYILYLSYINNMTNTYTLDVMKTHINLIMLLRHIKK